jgi:hypothetical protein
MYYRLPDLSKTRNEDLRPFRNVKLAALKHFYRMNDIELNWFKVSKYLGKHTRVVKDRAYTTEEIQHLLAKADELMRCVVLLLVSTGMRVGAIPYLKLRNITKIEDPPLYQLTLYENSPKEKGWNFIKVEDIPMLIQVVLSTCSISRAAIFEILIENNGILKTSQIVDSLNTTNPTASRTMTELKATGLVYMHDVNPGEYNSEKEIRLKPEFEWFCRTSLKS